MAKFFKKKKLLIIVASAIMSFSAFFAVGCKAEVENIDIMKNNSPQVVYVQGSDLNLASGKLTVVIDGKKSEIAMNDPKVSVTGYDKDALGEQVLTVTYEGQTTLLKVTVVPRVAVNKYEGSYFVGESFNEEKGELVITKDDGSNFVVPMDDETVTVSGFTTEQANENLEVTATYQKDDMNYSQTFNVAVYDVETVEFKAPNKKSYQNHETALDVSGGYISLKCENLTRYAQLTPDMVSGFDLSKATVEHRETPLVQTLTVTYLGQTKTYDVQIKFSDLSLINLRASEMKDLNWTSSELPSDCTEEMGENALEAMSVYFAMEDAEKKDIPDENIDYIVKVATAYGLQKWQTAFASYSDAFYLENGKTLMWNCQDFDKTNEAYQKILNKDPILYEDAAILVQIATDFAETVIYGEDKIGETLSAVYTPETIDAFAEQLALMISLHNALKDVPKDWTLDMLKNTYADEIHNAWVLLRETEFKTSVHRTLYMLTSRWREKNDYFEILYAYYYDKEDFTSINAFKDLRLPGELETLYSLLLSAKNELIYMQQGYQMESTNFMYYYETALEKKAEILASSEEMLKDLYARLEFDYLIGDGNGGYTLCNFDTLFNQYRRAPMGYLHHFNAYLGVDAYESLYDEYLATLKKVNDTYLESEEFSEAAESLLAGYLALSPKQQFSFMGLINPYYVPTAGGRYPLYAWEDDGEGYNNQFVYLIYTHYKKVLPESTHDIFAELMLASETLANYELVFAITEFKTRMENITELSERLNNRKPEDWEAFNDVFGWLLLEYEGIMEKFENPAQPVQEELTAEQEADFNELVLAINEAFFLMQQYQANIQSGRNISVVFYAAMEKVESLADEILQSGDPKVVRAYSYDASLTMGSKLTFPSGQEYPFYYSGLSVEACVYILRDTYTNLLTGSVFIKELMWDVYQERAIQDFLQESSYIFYNYITMLGAASPEADYVYFKDVEKMTNLMKAFSTELNDEQRHFFLVLDSNFRIYHSALARFALERNVEIATVTESLLKVEYMYVYYKENPDGESDGKSYKDWILTEYALLVSDYEELKKVSTEATDDETKKKALEDFNTYFGTMYEFYVAVCEELKAA